MDFKTRLGASFIVALVIAIMVYAFLNPVVVFYLDIVPTLFSCGTSGLSCEISSMLISIAVPLFALFLCVASVFEVFLK